MFVKSKGINDFPHAHDIRQESIRNYELLTDEMIFDGISKEAHNGNRVVYFHNAEILKETAKYLKKRKYKVSVGIGFGNSPYVRIAW